ncbi:MAG: C13 family peptidase, partial [Myxococcales bacterium]
RAVKRLSPSTQVLLSSSGGVPSLMEQLGVQAEGLEGTSLAPDPSSGFEIAYRVRFAAPPPPFSANVYDALSIIVYGLERSGGEGGSRLADAVAEVVDARGEPTSWDMDGIGRAKAAIRSGSLPNIAGASGPLDYDLDVHMDPIASTFGLWRVEYGDFFTSRFLSSRGGARAISSVAAFRQQASVARQQDLSGGEDVVLAARTGLWAVLISGSRGWENYRHQADVLAQYQFLRGQGLSDDRIVLIVQDDLAQAPQNSEPGVVRNVPNGPNVMRDVRIDYRPSDLSVADLLSVLLGTSSARVPTVVTSGPGDQLVVFLASHGSRSGVLWDGINGAELLEPAMLAGVFDQLYAARRYRRALVVVEACEGGGAWSTVGGPQDLAVCWGELI